MAAFLEGERVRVSGWSGVWKIKKLWNPNAGEGYRADLVRIDEPEPSERYRWTRGSAQTCDLIRHEEG